MGIWGTARLLPAAADPTERFSPKKYHLLLNFPPKNLTYFSTSVCTQPFHEAICRARSAIAKASWKRREFWGSLRGATPKTHPKVRIGAPHHAQKRGSRVVSAPYALLLQNLATGSPKICQILLIGCFWSSCAGETLLWGKRELGTIVPTGACDPLDPPFWVIFEILLGYFKISMGYFKI